MTSKKFFLSLATCALVLAFGIASPLAANDSKGLVVQIDVTTNKVLYSTDGGKTWSKDKPHALQKSDEGRSADEYQYIVNADGSVSVLDAKTDAAISKGTMARINVETNDVDYSTDGGKTWSKEKPKDLK